jgi:acetyl-CoA/propionyl-CoA carboxylase, biotin carboxylase, biotin carboxyl carrier protein
VSVTRRPIHTVLVANRGEIALRVIRACRETGRRSVAIYTGVDHDAPHVRAADEAVEVRSYLDIEAVVAAAQSANADAVHPGYGFLSERAAFAEALEAAEIRLVGPTAAVMDAMGRKDAAREVAVKAGVPVVPTGEDAPFPVLVKAAAGGGGKGMRIVRRAEDFDEAVAAAQREALSAFGDDTILVEKYVEHGRHIEVQVLADHHGNVVHLHERDCSTQRRHQKVLEEAPAPTISDAVRRLVTESAVALAREVGYTNAGTVEFLLDTETDEAYFLEMNTRLQVEHPVTEAVTGLDLVHLQLDVAAGEPLPFDQDDIRVDGHAIEARVYAEDSFGGFLPQAGRASLVRWPTGVRVDQALESGQVVSTAYDPMLGKVIAHGPDREAARLALLRALDRTEILGLTTNTGFLRALVAGDEFRTAAIDTAWLDHHDVAAPDPAPARQLAAWEVFLCDREESGPFASDGFRLSGDQAPVVIQLDEPVVLGPRPAVRPAATIRQGRVEVTYQGQRFVFERADVFADHGPAAGDGTVAAPMPGTVLDVRVAVGDAVSEGDVLGVVEAMKMELALKAPFAGTVSAVDTAVGEQVGLGDTLFVVEASE